MQAQDSEFTFSTGEQGRLSDLWAEKPVAFVFLRHLGCMFCRAHVAELREHPDLNIVHICNGDQATAEEFKREMKSPFPFICDPEEKLFDLYELKEAEMGDILNPKVVASAVKNLFKANFQGAVKGNPKRLGGTFVIKPGGEITWKHVSEDPADNASADAIRQALNSAA